MGSCSLLYGRPLCDLRHGIALRISRDQEIGVLTRVALPRALPEPHPHPRDDPDRDRPHCESPPYSIPTAPILDTPHPPALSSLPVPPTHILGEKKKAETNNRVAAPLLGPRLLRRLPPLQPRLGRHDLQRRAQGARGADGRDRPCEEGPSGAGRRRRLGGGIYTGRGEVMEWDERCVWVV